MKKIMILFITLLSLSNEIYAKKFLMCEKGTNGGCCFIITVDGVVPDNFCKYSNWDCREIVKTTPKQIKDTKNTLSNMVKKIENDYTVFYLKNIEVFRFNSKTDASMVSLLTTQINNSQKNIK